MQQAMHELDVDAGLQQELAKAFMGTADWMRNQ
jgi:truncated hemoglobin YjbI